ncbi:MAG: hypothetical protein Q4D04_02440 [Clostridia bacterium]|nr:hypothetical protein [Clostridia bacterium]
MEKRKYSGRQLILYGAVLLLVWAGYECYIRFEMLSQFLTGLINLCANEGVPFARAISYFPSSMFSIALYMLVLALFSVACVILRNRPMGDYVVLALTIAIAITGGAWVGLFSLSVLNWAQSLKTVPLLMIAAGCVVNISQFHVSGIKKRRQDDGEKDYTKMNRRQLADQVKRHRAGRKKDVA